MEGNFAAIILVHQKSKYTILKNMRSGRRSETKRPKKKKKEEAHKKKTTIKWLN